MERKKSLNDTVTSLCHGYERFLHFVSRGFAQAGIRLLMLTVFAVVVFQFAIRPPIRANVASDIYSQAALRGVNAGYPLYFYGNPAHLDDASRPIQKSEIVEEVGSGYIDVGLSALIGWVGSVGRAIVGPNFRFTAQSIYYILFGLFLASATVIVWPSIPLPISASALVAFGLNLTINTPPLARANLLVIGLSSQTWAGYSVLISAVFIACCWVPFGRRFMWLGYILLGLLAGLGRLIREEGFAIIVTSLVAVILITLCSLIAHGLFSRHHWKPVWRDTIRPVLIQVLVASNLFLCANLFMNSVLTWSYSNAYGRPASEITFPSHGTGHPLYLSFGWSNNPFNIDWNDDTGYQHALLYDSN